MWITCWQTKSEYFPDFQQGPKASYYWEQQAALSESQMPVSWVCSEQDQQNQQPHEQKAATGKGACFPSNDTWGWSMCREDLET